jgi:type I restriction enzyme S subunit
MPEVITDNLDLWTSALLTKSTAGRGSNGKLEAHGIKKLRELILELAVRGKLVPQEPNDEPASVSLGKIAKEKTRLIKEGLLKKEKLLPDIGDDEKSFELPLGWEWVRFGTIAKHNSGKTLDSGRNTGQLRDYITTSNLYWGQFDLVNIRQMPIPDGELGKCTARKGDLLICEGGEAGRAAVWPYDHEVCFQNHIHRARFYGEEIDPYFVYHFFEKLNASGEIDQHRKGVGISNMSSKTLALIALPLPPFAEQHRIVAKVDELMALCDQLEQQQTDSLAAHQTLVETLLGTLTRVESQQEFNAAWARIASHFDTLFTTEASIDQLKQTILQLAVMGKLAPQDPSDEPASLLLEKILSEKERLTREGAIRTQQRLPEVSSAETPYELPDGWVWTRLGNVGLGSTGKTPSTGNPEYYGGDIPFIGPGQITPAGEILESDKALTAEGCKLSVVAAPGDILMVCIGGSIGKSAIVYSQVAFNQQINSLRPLLVSSELLNYSMSTPQFQAAVLEKATGSATPIINRSKWEELLVPIPPEVEQHRIVAKVDELMALCDALKAHFADAQTTQIHLADAIVEQAVC